MSCYEIELGSYETCMVCMSSFEMRLRSYETCMTVYIIGSSDSKRRGKKLGFGSPLALGTLRADYGRFRHIKWLELGGPRPSNYRFIHYKLPLSIK